jgi:hypothetical protein
MFFSSKLSKQPNQQASREAFRRQVNDAIAAAVECRVYLSDLANDLEAAVADLRLQLARRAPV